jgi:hypothetical protein
MLAILMLIEIISQNTNVDQCSGRCEAMAIKKEQQNEKP